MRALIAFGLMVTALTATHLAGQEGPAPSRKASDEDYKKLLNASKFDGKVSGVGPKSISVFIDDTQYQWYLKKVQAMPDSPLKFKYLKELELKYKSSNLGKEYEFEFAEKVALRKLQLVFDYDERGKPKVYTPAEKAKLKGDASKPGYMAKADDFAVGAPVTVYLTRGKNNRPIATMAVVNNAAKPVP